MVADRRTHQAHREEQEGAPVKKRNQTFKVTLEPAIDAKFRIYCTEKKVPYNSVIRQALKDLIALEGLKSENIPTQRDTYGQLGSQPFTVRLNPVERRNLETTCTRLKINNRRSYSRLIRHAVTLFVSSSSSRDASHQEQSQELASEDTLPPSAS